MRHCAPGALAALFLIFSFSFSPSTLGGEADSAHESPAQAAPTTAPSSAVPAKEKKKAPSGTKEGQGKKDGGAAKDPSGKSKQEKKKKKAKPSDQEIVVTASRLPTPREETGVSMTVIHARDVRTNQDNHAAEVLRMAPGLTINQAGRKGGFTSLITRGGESDQTLILYDGWKVNRQGGFFSLESLDPLALDRIEIARGPGSSLYGTDAVTGTVNLITRKGEGRPAITTSGAGGTYGTDRETQSTQGRQGKFSWNVSSAHLHRQEATLNNSELETFNYAARFDYDFNDGHSLKLIARGVDFKKGFYESNASGFGTAVEPPDPNDTLSNQSLLVGLEYRGKPVPIWESVARLGYYGADFRLTSRNPNVASNVIAPPFNVNFPGRTFNQERRQTGEWINHITAFESTNFRNIVTVGLRAEGESFNQDDTKFGNNVRFHHVNYAGYFQNRLELFGRAFLTGGFRREQNEEFGSFVTARGDISILIPESGTRIFGSMGNAFRAPAFQELFAPFFGNPGLKPEENFAFDAGIEQHFWKRRIRLSATFFQNRFADLIAFDFGSSTLGNIGKAKTRGFELQASFRPVEQLTLEGTATLLSSRDASGTRLLRRPPRTYTGRLTAHPLKGWAPKSLDGLDLSLELLHVSSRSDLGPTPGNPFATVRNGSYTRADLAVSYRFLTHFRAFVRVENFTDEKYEEVKTFPTDGSNTLGGLEFSWRF